ncbi:MAG: type I methionyl aminopeptidase [Myxococcales bacterium]|nr:MAG: type I methionyl aminopeptidase [Myxococcales bacterium]
MIHLKSSDEIERLFEAGQIVRVVHDALEKLIAPGISTAELDAEAEAIIRRHGGIPAFKGYRGYPATICASINEEVVHGIPSPKRKLKEGDLLGIDLGVILNGWIGDAARSHVVGLGSEEAERLNRATRESLDRAIAAMTTSGRLGDIGHAIQSHVEAQGFSVVRQFVGHGVGRNLHEDPQVPNYGRRGTGMRLQEGLVLAIEPMINAGAFEVEVLEDGWTAVTVDGRLSAHWEHSIAITADGPRVLT